MRKTGWVLLAGWIALAGVAVADESVFSDPTVDPKSRVLPEYPPAALAAGFDAMVTLAAVINADGSLGAVEVIEDTKPHLGFGDAAVRAIQNWRFAPAQAGGTNVDAVGAFVFRYHPVGRLAQGSLITGELFMSSPIQDGLTDKGSPGQLTGPGFSPARHVKKAMQKYGLPPTTPFALYDRTKLIPVPRRSVGTHE